MQQINEIIDNKNRDEEYEILKPNNKDNKDNNMRNMKKLISRYKLIITILSFFCIFLVVFVVIYYNIQKSKSKKRESLIRFYRKFLIMINKGKKNKRNIRDDNNKTQNNNSIINQTNNENKEINNINGNFENNINNNNISIFLNTSNNLAKINNNITNGKRKIYVKYMDFWPAFVVDNFDVHKILLEKYEVIFTEQPDYIVFSEFGGENRYYNCVKLFLSIENRDPNFYIRDYAIGIH